VISTIIGAESRVEVGLVIAASLATILVGAGFLIVERVMVPYSLNPARKRGSTFASR
jgi:hypothetical protein